MKTAFEITSKVPVPTVGKRPARYAKYPFKDMKPGDSFFVPFGKKQTVYSAARAAAIRGNGKHFIVRSVVERGVPGARVWRSE